MERNAASLFAAFLVRRETGEAIGFETFAGEHAEHAAELLELWSKHQAIERALRGAPADEKEPAGSFFHLSCRKERRRREGSTHPSLGPGDRLGDFLLIRLLGTGGMGRVYEAMQTDLRRKVALKLVLPERMDERSLELFAREARAGGRLSHPGIVGVHGYGETDGVHWINQELVEEGWTLRDFLDEIRRADTLPRDYYRRIAAFIIQVAEALQAAHDAGVIHRDIKPQNILIGPDDRPKVGDFGLARVSGESALTLTGDFAGTYLYMSPEQVAARRMGLDHRTDIFSLGVVLYELLSLRRPFEGDTTHQIAEKILTWDPPDLHRQRSRIPADLSSIAGKMLEKRPADRYQSMGDVAEELGRYLANEPVLAQPPGPVRRLQKWAIRNPTRSLVGAVAAVAFLVISILALHVIHTNRALRSQETEARMRAADVLRLSLSQDLDDLIADSEDLSPPVPDRIPALRSWLQRAHEITAQLPGLRAKRDELRSLALPRSAQQRVEERRSHPDFPKLAVLRARIDARRRALEARCGAAMPDLPKPDWSQFPHSGLGMNKIAWDLVRPGREVEGREPLGVALAARAAEELEGAERARALDTLAWGRFALGDDEGAVEASARALAVAPEAERATYEDCLSAIKEATASASSESGIAASRAELAGLEGDLAALERRVDERRHWEFPPEAEVRTRARWWHNQIDSLIARIEELSDPTTGLASANGISERYGWSIPRRLALAERLESGSAPGGDYARAWEEALPRIRAAYPGLSLSPQVGLVPLGPAPDSGLWEFWDVQSGARPERDGDGHLRLDAESGLVFVLIPGGRFRMGAQAADPEGPGFDPDADDNEEPIHTVTVRPFFLSKFEMTQEAWERLAGHNPSKWTSSTLGSAHTAALPVDQVSWYDAMLVLGHAGMTLPSEAQWEYACRAGTTTPRPFDPEDFARHANVAEQSFQRTFAAAVAFEEWDDGFARPAPVGSLLPNAFGLHDMLGGLWEWCYDGYDRAFYGMSPEMDPACTPEGDQARICRGGSFTSPAAQARSSIRFAFGPAGAVNYLGVRPARPILD